MQTYGPKQTTAPSGAIVVSPGDNISAVVNQAPAGATFYFQPGVYRQFSIEPKEGQSFIGAEGAVLSGAEVLSGFRSEGAHWVVDGQTQQGIRRATEEGDGVSYRPGFPETVFIDDVPLTPVDSLANVGPGKFYFDYDADQIFIAQMRPKKSRTTCDEHTIFQQRRLS